MAESNYFTGQTHDQALSQVERTTKLFVRSNTVTKYASRVATVIERVTLGKACRKHVNYGLGHETTEAKSRAREETLQVQHRAMKKNKERKQNTSPT